jgi:hypothetical protein
MSIATCGIDRREISPGCRFAHPGYACYARALRLLDTTLVLNTQRHSVTWTRLRIERLNVDAPLPIVGLDRPCRQPGGRNRRDWPLQQPLSAIRRVAVGPNFMIA